jgi:hypothetical protein
MRFFQRRNTVRPKQHFDVIQKKGINLSFRYEVEKTHSDWIGDIGCRLSVKSCAGTVLLRDQIGHVSTKPLALIDRSFNRNRWFRGNRPNTKHWSSIWPRSTTTAVFASSSKFTKMSWQCQSVSMGHPICSLIEPSSIYRHQPRRHCESVQGSYYRPRN